MLESNTPLFPVLPFNPSFVAPTRCFQPSCSQTSGGAEEWAIVECLHLIRWPAWIDSGHFGVQASGTKSREQMVSRHAQEVPTMTGGFWRWSKVKRSCILLLGDTRSKVKRSCVFLLGDTRSKVKRLCIFVLSIWYVF